MLNLGTVPANTTIYIPFATYDGATGASESCSGLAVTDIEIYKNGSTAQRSSDAGYALLDTDGIDFDGITGINGFSIDLSDNTDAGFYAVGSWYWVIVSSITADGQTVNFIAAIFRIGPAEAVAGYPKADAQYVEGTDATNQIRDAVVDDATRIDATALNTLSGHDPGATLVKIADLGTVQTGDSFAIVNGDHGLVSIQDDIDTLLTRILGTLAAGTHTAQSGDSYAIVNGDHGLVSIQDDVDTLLTRIVGTLDTGTHKPQSGDAYPRVGNVEGAVTLLQSLQVILAYVSGKTDGGGTATLHFRDQGDTKNRLTMTVDADGNRSAVTPSFD